jgi:hypothetical protein
VVTVEVDGGEVERRLVAGELVCPGCGGRLACWGWARTRQVRDREGLMVLSPRRARRVGLEGADRFANFGYGSVFRLKPFRPHLTVSALSCAAGQHDTTTVTHGHRIPLPSAPSEALPPPSATDPAWGRSDWTFTSKLGALSLSWTLELCRFSPFAVNCSE